jgi:GPH family glycoside/pentoside/hexuronide:cation symporter
MFVLGIAQVTVIVITASLSGSILADVVDARAVDTGRREEGLLFSVQSFISKVASGIGVSIAGMVLTLISFPSDSLRTALIPETVSNLGWAYAGTLGFFFVLSIITLLFYSADRATHEQNISILDRLS